MLQKLVIKNVALIDSAEIELVNGLNVLSGETGSGKSVIIESLNFVLGAKADKTMIRSGQTECFVKAEFFLNNVEDFLGEFKDSDIDPEQLLIISRKFSIDGKSQIKINGNTVTVGMLKKFTSKLVDVHGQSEHFNLLKNSNQLSLIDRLGKDEVIAVKDSIKTLLSEYKGILSELNRLGGDESHRIVKIDILNFQIKEIESADVKNGEEEELLIIKEKLKYQEKILSALNSVKCAINEDGGVSDVLGNATRIFSTISELDKKYSELYDRLYSAYSEIDDISDSAKNLIEEFDVSEYNSDTIEERLAVIKALKKKYGNSYEEIETFLSNAKTERDTLENFNEVAKDLNDRKEKLQVLLYEKYNQLSKIRKEVSLSFSKSVINQLKQLGMNNASFNVNFDDFASDIDCEYNSPNGIDRVEFMFSANLGEPLKPLSMVISGGEMSRFMLAIKTHTSKYNSVSTFIFDEIDAGISGVIAQVVAEKFAVISKNIQIVAISHLPQISAMADNNLLISKQENENTTKTIVDTLDSKNKVLEIIRLIGGDADSETAKQHAMELIKRADEYKKSIKF